GRRYNALDAPAGDGTAHEANPFRSRQIAGEAAVAGNEGPVLDAPYGTACPARIGRHCVLSASACATHVARGAAHCLDDILIAGAAAEIRGEQVKDLVVA